jgi:glycosyltransferase involved in cell wall biosynthesis
MIKDLQLSVVTLMFNEILTAEQSIMDIYQTFSELNIVFEIIVIESGSNDGTTNVISKLSNRFENIKFVHSNVRDGYKNDLIKGLISSEAPKILLVDSGGKFLQRDLIKIFKNSNDVDLIIGNRKYRNDQIYRKLLTKFYGLFLYHFYRLNFKLDADSGLSLISENFKNFIISSPPVFMHLYRSEIAILCLKHNFIFRQIDVSYLRRHGKSRGMPNGKLIMIIVRVLLDNIKLKGILRAHGKL